MKDRKHLVAAEVEKLLAATKGTRNEARDRCFLLLMFRHGLRVSEACGLVLSQVDIDSRMSHVTRFKDGLSTTHSLHGDELRTINAWLADRTRMKPDTDAFFLSERRGPLSRKTAWVMIREYSRLAGLPVAAHPHCCAMPAASPWPTKAQIRDSFKTISDTGICGIPSATPPPTRHGLRGSGGRIPHK